MTPKPITPPLQKGSLRLIKISMVAPLHSSLPNAAGSVETERLHHHRISCCPSLSCLFPLFATPCETLTFVCYVPLCPPDHYVLPLPFRHYVLPSSTVMSSGDHYVLPTYTIMSSRYHCVLPAPTIVSSLTIMSFAPYHILVGRTRWHVTLVSIFDPDLISLFALVTRTNHRSSVEDNPV